GIKLKDVSQFADADTVLGEALAIQRQLVKDFPTVSDYWSELGGTLNNLAGSLIKQKKFAQARQLLTEAIERQQLARKANPEHPNYRLYLRNHYDLLAHTLKALGEHGPAGKALEEVITLGKELVKEPPGLSEHRLHLAAAYRHLGELYLLTQPHREH